jgi:MFS family permease
MTDDAAVETAADHAWLTPGVRGIGTASLLADVGHEIPTALLPSLLTSTIGAPASVLAAGTGFATTAWQVGLLRAGAWTARGLRVPSRNALLADVVHPSAYGRAYGFERAMDNLGAIIGPILAIGLVATIGTRWAIAVSVIPGIAAALAIVYAIRHTRAPQARERIPVRLRKSRRRSRCRHFDHRSKNRLRTSPSALPEIRVGVEPGLSQARRPPARLEPAYA